MDIAKKILTSLTVILIVLFLISSTIVIYNDSTDNVIRIGHLNSQHDSPLYVADALGLYKAQGIEVEFYEFNNGGDLMAALAGGSIDVGYLGITPFLSSIDKEVPVKIVSPVQEEGSAIIVGKNSNIHSIKDLKGKTIGHPGESSIQYALLIYELEKEGINKDDVRLVSIKVSSMSDALKTNAIDGMISYEPYASIAVSNGYGDLLKNSSEILPGHPCCVIVTSDNFINEHPNELKKIIDINKNATKYIEDNPDESTEMLPKTVLMNITAQKEIMKNMKFITDITDDYKNKVFEFIKIEKDLGLIKHNFTEEQIFYTM